MKTIFIILVALVAFAGASTTSINLVLDGFNNKYYNSDRTLIGVGNGNVVEKSNASFILVGDGNTISGVDGVGILSGYGIKVDSALDAYTTIMQNANVRGSVRTSAIRDVVAGTDDRVHVDDHILLYSGNATIHMGGIDEIPDGMRVILRNVEYGDASGFLELWPTSLSCMESNCTICVVHASCVAEMVLDVPNTSCEYVFRASANQWIEL
jgi:hypothetical protein